MYLLIFSEEIMLIESFLFTDFWHIPSTFFAHGGFNLVKLDSQNEDIIIESLLALYVEFKKKCSILYCDQEFLEFLHPMKELMSKLYEVVRTNLKRYNYALVEYFGLEYG